MPAGPAPTTAIVLAAAAAGVSFSSRLAARERIDEAGRDLAREDVVEARLVAADARVDLVGAILPPPC